LRRYLAALGRLGHERAVRSQLTTSHNPAQVEEAETLWRAVRRLKETDQQVIYLRYFLELPVAEAAQVLDVAPGTVKSRLHRALERLRAVVEHEFPMLWEEREV
jgi:RNA polymerase sigma-70 factor (ECF subfamily)